MMENVGPNKAIAAGVGGAGGTALGGALAALVVGQWMPHADPSVAVNLATVFNAAIGAGGAFLAAWLTPHGGSPNPAP